MFPFTAADHDAKEFEPWNCLITVYFKFQLELTGPENSSPLSIPTIKEGPYLCPSKGCKVISHCLWFALPQPLVHPFFGHLSMLGRKFPPPLQVLQAGLQWNWHETEEEKKKPQSLIPYKPGSHTRGLQRQSGTMRYIYRSPWTKEKWLGIREFKGKVKQFTGMLKE